ncbi:DUF5665 domain-containing protein [Roseovarius sp.]|uniref:DUF5665 domain-containing protein n=1 Tax=Roseovarius sp. TaxID=1486281 RepID=UPI0025CE5CA6|nr:DUF5665 domain-containing protein [Roseovarius sp.]
MKDDGAAPEDLTRELHALRAELHRLNSHRFIRVHNSVPRMLAFNFARGLAVGLGTVLGASVLLSLLVWGLSQIEFLPIIGEWAAQISRQMRELQ